MNKLLLTLFALLLSFSGSFAQTGKPTDKIQEFVILLQKRFSNETQDYITDGQSIVWVKSYKKWTPQDITVLKREQPNAWKFLVDACNRNRTDVLNQLIPDYYRNSGGVSLFQKDILKQ